MRRFIIIVFALALVSGPVVADIVYLKNGAKFEGKVVREGDYYVIIRGKSRIKVPADQVDRIEKAETVDDIYAKKVEELDQKDAKAWYVLAQWCRERKLRPEARECLEKVVRLDPAHKAAHRDLGHVQHEGHWMTRQEALLSKGFVLVDGQWLSPSEQAAHAAAQKKRDELKAKVAQFTEPIDNLGHKDDGVRKKARSSILARKSEFMPYLAYFARLSKNWKIRKACVELIDEIGYTDPRYSNLLAYMAYHDAQSKVRNYCGDVIKWRKDDRALLQLVRVAAAGELSSRKRAAEAVKRLRDVRALRALVYILASQVGAKPKGTLNLDRAVTFDSGTGGSTAGFGIIHPAADSLEHITGKEFGNDAIKWAKFIEQATTPKK